MKWRRKIALATVIVALAPILLLSLMLHAKRRSVEQVRAQVEHYGRSNLERRVRGGTEKAKPVAGSAANDRKEARDFGCGGR